MNITIKQIAQLAKVSHTTVSRALNNDLRISEQTRKRIQKIARQHGYVKNSLASGFSKGKTYTIGVITNFIGNAFVGDILRGIETIANDNNYVLIFGDSQESPEREKVYIQTFAERQVDGLIIYPAHGDGLNESITKLQKLDIPFVLVDKYCESIKTDYVVCDDFWGGKLATEHLTNLGHTRIGHIIGSPCTSIQHRLEGYKSSLLNKNITIDPELIWASEFNPHIKNYDSFEQAKKLMQMDNPPSALFISTDGLAPGVFKAARELGVKIPQDLALVGFGDLDQISFMDIPLTTVSYPTFRIGALAANALLEKIDNKTKEIQQISIRPELVIRESCGAVK